MTLPIYFWNIKNRKNNVDIIARVVASEQNSLFAVAEPWSIEENDIRNAGIINYWLDPFKRTLLVAGSLVKFTFNEHRHYYSIFDVVHNNLNFILIVLHFKSKVYGENDATSLATFCIYEIKEYIKKTNNNHVVIIGDFNHSFFEDPLMKVQYLNNTNYFHPKDKPNKKVSNFNELKYYNPIAAQFGGGLNKPVGTYYKTSLSQSQAWYILDQALISYPLVRYIDRDECEILNEITSIRLDTKNGLPNKKYSDHFPIKIKFR